MTTPSNKAQDFAAPAGFGLLLRLKLTLLRNRVTQLVNESPLRLLLVFVFVATIWMALYAIFDNAFVFMRRFEQSAIAIPYVFHIFFMAMTFLLAFSTAVLVYGSLFSRAEPSFLLATPQSPRNIVIIMYLEALFFASWSLLLLGLPLMFAIGHAQGLGWGFYLTFTVAFLGFVPIPGALGLIAALVVAMWLPRLAKRTLFYTGGVAVVLVVVWWARLWAVSASSSNEWLHGFMAEFEYLKGALLPSTWVASAIQKTLEGESGDAMFYLGVTLSTSVFLSWAAVNIVGSRLLTAFGRAHAAPNRTQARSGWASHRLTELAFFYLPQKMRMLILKDVRDFLRDPMQWSQLAILFGLMGLYLAYLPRVRPDGFNVPWQALICFLNYGAITLILSTFTSRFVFPMMSLEGKQMWLVGLWPLQRERVMWAKFLYALTVTSFAALTVTILAIRALELPLVLAFVQASGTFATCIGLCGLAVGLGARMPSYHETNTGRISSGLGGTVNLIASVGLVTLSVGMFGGVCYLGASRQRLDSFGWIGMALFAAIIMLGVGAAVISMRVGIRCFRKQQF